MIKIYLHGKIKCIYTYESFKMNLPDESPLFSAMYTGSATQASLTTKTSIQNYLYQNKSPA